MNTLADLFPLPKVDRIELRRAPLALAVCQVQFPIVMSVAETAYLAPFQRAIQAKYPIASPVIASPVNAGVQIQLSVGDVATAPNAWQFSDQEGMWQIVLAPTSLSIETRGYTDFGEFLARLRQALDALSQHIRPVAATRIGLRYINELRAVDPDWQDIVSPPMLGPLAEPAFHAHTTQVAAVQQLVMRTPEGVGLIIHQGPLPNGAAVRPRSGQPSPEGPFYLLDFDVFREASAPAGFPMDAQRLSDDVSGFHDIIYRLFRWSITDQFLSTLTEG